MPSTRKNNLANYYELKGLIAIKEEELIEMEEQVKKTYSSLSKHKKNLNKLDEASLNRFYLKLVNQYDMLKEKKQNQIDTLKEEFIQSYSQQQELKEDLRLLKETQKESYTSNEAYLLTLREKIKRLRNDPNVMNYQQEIYRLNKKIEELEKKILPINEIIKELKHISDNLKEVSKYYNLEIFFPFFQFSLRTYRQYCNHIPTINHELKEIGHDSLMLYERNANDMTGFDSFRKELDNLADTLSKEVEEYNKVITKSKEKIQNNMDALEEYVVYAR